jgi:uncharacterized protein YciI
MPKFKVTLEVSTYVSAEVEADSAEEAEEKLSQAVDVVKDNFEEDYDIEGFERDGILTRLYEIHAIQTFDTK